MPVGKLLVHQSPDWTAIFFGGGGGKGWGELPITDQCYQYNLLSVSCVQQVEFCLACKTV